MKVLLQRVKKASIKIENEIYSEIGAGLLIFLGVEKEDSDFQAHFLASKICDLRIFEDEFGKMNLSVKDIEGEILIVSQFTLAGNCKKGTRPSFDTAKDPQEANKLYENFVSFVKGNHSKVKTGVFGAMMDVELINNGPVTFILTKE
ncbi:MAG: D-aminoacyl-tRNA deacylase [bacterium]